MPATTVPIRQLLWENQTATTTQIEMPAEVYAGSQEWAIYVTFDHTSAAGTIVLEDAPYSGYAGAWVNVGTITWAAIDSAKRIAVTGVFGALRLRISVAVTSGTCSAYAVATN